MLQVSSPSTTVIVNQRKLFYLNFSDVILTNLVYGQNFGNTLLICGSWLWYLANDMQYYVTFLALLFIYAR